MSLVSVQISTLSKVLLSWTFIYRYSESFSFNELYKGMTERAIPTGEWGFHTRYEGKSVTTETKEIKFIVLPEFC